MKIKYLLNKYRRALIVCVHLLLIVLAYLLSFFIRFDFRLSPQHLTAIVWTLPVLLAVKMPVFNYYGLFSGIWRYASIDDSLRIIKANFFASVFFAAAALMVFHQRFWFPRSLFVLDSMVCCLLVVGARFSTRLYKEQFRGNAARRIKRVLIVGGGEAGVMVLREYRNNPAMNIRVVGFIDDSPLKKNLRIQGVKILGTRHDIADAVGQYRVDEIIIAIPSAKGEDIRDIISRCRIPNVSLKIAPGLQRILNGELEVKLREVKPEDLLGRETARINEEEICSYIRGRCILVTGAGGSIGSALCRHIARFEPREIIFFDHNENNVYFLGVEFKTRHPGIGVHTVIGDINDIGLLRSVFSRYRPQVVFHAAAHKHVPLMEENLSAAIKNNVVGTRNLIYASHHYRVQRFVLISTDKAVNPTSIMGVTKRIAEMILQAKARVSPTRFMAVRFGNVIGSDGSVIPLFKRQIEEGGPVTITHPDAKRYFMSADEAAQLVIQAGALGEHGEIFILDMGEQIRIFDLARNLIMLSGLQPGKDIPISFIGMRPGEKLFEETLFDRERDHATKYDKIFIAKPDHFRAEFLRRQIKELERYARLMDSERIVEKIREIVPGFNGRSRR